MIRKANPDDLAAITKIAASTNMFLGDELESFQAMLSEHLNAGADDPSVLLVATREDGPEARVLGAAYFAPEVMAQGVMNLLFIGVAPDARKHGLGQALLNAFEDGVRDCKARLAIIETASDDMFAPAWSLYRKAGYREEARIRDFYEEGLDKLVFWKKP